MIGKKGQGLSMTVIVVAILALVILVLLLLVLTGRLALFGGAAQECPGICEFELEEGEVRCPSEYVYLGPARRYINRATGERCPNACCIPVTRNVT